MAGLAQSDAEINRRDECRTVCRLIFRGDPCIILGSDILSVSMSAPRYPSEMKNPDAVPCNSALNPGHWGFSITPQMEWMPLHKAKEASALFILSLNVFSCRLELKNKWTHFCHISLIWNHITAACRDGSFWSAEVNLIFFLFFFFFLWNPLKFTFTALFVVSQETFTHCSALLSYSAPALKTDQSLPRCLWQLRMRPAFPKCH